MVQTDGWAPSSENPAIGPPVYSMVRYGAKEAALIVYKKEWWRLLSSTMLHAGVWHLIPNVAIQVSECMSVCYYVTLTHSLSVNS